MCVALSSCGKKQRTFFVFSEQKKLIKASKFDFPVVKNVLISHGDQGHMISWDPVDSFIMSHDMRHNLLGYNVYSLTQHSLISRQPLNKQPLQEAFYIDRVIDSEVGIYRYVVRPVFSNRLIKNAIGFSSKVAGIKR